MLVRFLRGAALHRPRNHNQLRLFSFALCQAGTNSLATPNSSFGIPAEVPPPSENPRAPQISSAPLPNKTRVAARPSPNKLAERRRPFQLKVPVKSRLDSKGCSVSLEENYRSLFPHGNEKCFAHPERIPGVENRGGLCRTVTVLADASAGSARLPYEIQMKVAKIFSGYTHASMRPDSFPATARVP